MSKDNKVFSVYRCPIKNKIPYQEVTTKDVYTVVTSLKYQPVTDKLRSSTKEQAKEIKATLFDYVTFSGTFTERANDALLIHSGRICIDLDHLQNIAEVSAQILKDYIPELMFISPSGDGLKVVYLIDMTLGTHLDYFMALEAYFKQQYCITIDPACKDVSRACFLPYSPDCHYSDTPTLLDRSFIDTFKEEVTDEKTNHEGIITDFREIYRRLNVWVDKKVTFANGNRNRYITKFTAALNRYGVPEDFVLGELISFAQEDFTRDEIESTVKSIYRNSKLFNTEHFGTNTNAGEHKPKKEIIAPVPLLPIEGLPDFLQKLITECSEVYGTHRDLWAGAFLASTALAIGQTYQLKGKYSNSSVLWLSLVAPSGIGKTEPLKFAFKPFHKIDMDSVKVYEGRIKEYENIKAMTKSERKEAGFTDMPEIPICKQYILSDATPEAVIQANKNNPRGINIVRDELHGFLLDIGRYNKSGEMQNWLSSWSQDSMTVNRMKANPIKIEHPFINITGGIQPGIIPELAKDHRFFNGFIPRWCFVFPDDVKRPEYLSNELSDSVKNDYYNYITNLLSLTGICESVVLSERAESIYKTFVNNNTVIYNTEKNNFLQELYCKLDIIVLRISVIIHLSKWGCTGIDEPSITPETMHTAINITEYFRVTGQKVHSYLSAGNYGLDLKNVAKYLHTRGASQMEISRAIKVSQPYINKILNT